MLEGYIQTIGDRDKLFGLYVGQIKQVEGDVTKSGRVKVMIDGLNHDTPTNKHLPWARVAQPPYKRAQLKPLVDSYVYVQFLGGDVSMPIVIGVVAGDDDGGKEVRGEDSVFTEARKGAKTTFEKNPYIGTYPNIDSLLGDGYEVVLDDGEKPQIKLQTLSGAHMEISDDEVQLKSIKEFRLISGEAMKQYVNDNYTIKVGGEMEITASKLIINCDLQVNGKITATGDVKAGSISLQNHRHTFIAKSGPDSLTTLTPQ